MEPRADLAAMVAATVDSVAMEVMVAALEAAMAAGEKVEAMAVGEKVEAALVAEETVAAMAEAARAAEAMEVVVPAATEVAMVATAERGEAPKGTAGEDLVVEMVVVQKGTAGEDLAVAVMSAVVVETLVAATARVVGTVARTRG